MWYISLSRWNTRAEPAEVAELRDALPDPVRLRVLANWFDHNNLLMGSLGGDDVQVDLRKWADAAEAAPTTKETP